MTRTRRLARRQIAVVEHVPTQLVLGLPLGMTVVAAERMDPEPVAPVALPAIGRRAAA